MYINIILIHYYFVNFKNYPKIWLETQNLRVILVLKLNTHLLICTGTILQGDYLKPNI